MNQRHTNQNREVGIVGGGAFIERKELKQLCSYRQRKKKTVVCGAANKWEN